MNPRRFACEIRRHTRRRQVRWRLNIAAGGAAFPASLTPRFSLHLADHPLERKSELWVEVSRRHSLPNPAIPTDSHRLKSHMRRTPNILTSRNPKLPPARLIQHHPSLSKVR